MNGAEGENNLEPFPPSDLLLETLEEWSEILKGDEEITHMLAEFKHASFDEVNDIEHEDAFSAERTSPETWEPSP